MEKLKVLYFTNIPSPYRVEFFNELGKYCDLTVIFERKVAEDRDKEWMSFDDALFRFKPVFLKGIITGSDTALCCGVCKYWEDKQYDIRIVGDYATPTGILSVIYLKARCIEYAVECDGGFVNDNESSIKLYIKRLLLKKTAFAYSPGIITDEYLRRYGVSQIAINRYHFSSITREDIACAKEYRKKRKQLREEYGIGQKRVVLFVGQIIYRKGIDILLEASTLLNEDYRIIIAGGLPTEEYIEYIEVNSIENVEFVGFKQKEELRKLYAIADLFCLPTREDIWGLVVIEAMSYGIPVITTEMCVSGRELLKNQEYSIVKVNDSRALAKSISVISEKYTESYGKENQRIAEEYTIEQMTEDHMKSFERIMAE